MATLKLTKASRSAYAKAGVALPDGKFPIPDKAHLRAAIAYRHSTSEPYGKVAAHIEKRAKELGQKVHLAADRNIIVITLPAGALTAAGAPKGKFGRSASLKWPHLYDILRSKGYDKSASAAISNSRVAYRKKGRLNVLDATEAHDPAVLKRLAAAEKAGKHVTRKQLTSGK